VDEAGLCCGGDAGATGGAGSGDGAGSLDGDGGGGGGGGAVTVVVCGGPHATKHAVISNSRILMRASYTRRQMNRPRDLALTRGPHE
jgi:hypothetical protein